MKNHAPMMAPVKNAITYTLRRMEDVLSAYIGRSASREVRSTANATAAEHVEIDRALYTTVAPVAAVSKLSNRIIGPR